MLEVVPESGSRREASTDNPLAAATADSASSTGTPAAMIAPKAISRISSVTGRLTVAAVARSAPTWLLIALLTEAPPACSISRSGCPRWTAAVAASSGSIRSDAVSGSPFMVTGTSRAVASLEMMGTATEATSGSAFIRLASWAAAR